MPGLLVAERCTFRVLDGLINHLDIPLGARIDQALAVGRIRQPAVFIDDLFAGVLAGIFHRLGASHPIGDDEKAAIRKPIAFPGRDMEGRTIFIIGAYAPHMVFDVEIPFQVFPH
jgi:hypothetical protein